MLDAPPSNAIQHYLFENPWPVALTLITLAAIIGWLGLREGLRGRSRLGAALLALGLAALVAGWVVTTAGEHGRRVARELVERVVAEDTIGGLSLFREDATLNAGSPQNPGFGMDIIRDRFVALAERHDIESNSITRLDGYSVSGEEAEVRLACLTTVAAFPYPNASQWIMRIWRGDDGEWKIAKLTCVAINDRTPEIDRAW